MREIRMVDFPPSTNSPPRRVPTELSLSISAIICASGGSAGISASSILPATPRIPPATPPSWRPGAAPARPLSFVETGRAAPSREMVLKLAERLEVPLRERNVLLVAAGFAPAFPQRALDDPALKSARAAIDLVLKAHEPNPALAVDRHWNLVSANRMVTPLLAGISPDMLAPPLNVMRLG